MSTTDFGTQTVSIDFFLPANADEFNKLLYRAIPTGIYEGFELSSVDNTTVQVSTGACFISDIDNELTVKVSTSATVDLTVSSSGAVHYIVLRFDWVDVENNYMDILAVIETDIRADDLVLGRVIYDGSTMDSVMDYSLRSDSAIKLSEDTKNSFKVTPTEVASVTINVASGTAIINGKKVVYAGGTYAYTSPADDTTLGRIDLIFVDASGTIGRVLGVDSATPEAPEYPSSVIVIAEIERGAARDTIKGNEINQINNYSIERYQSSKSVSLDVTASLTDYDNLTSGIYYYDGTGTPTNEPSGSTGNAVIIEVTVQNGNLGIQRVTDLTTHNVYTRTNSTSWSTWENVLQSSNIIDTLVSTSTADALSAAKGKALEDGKIDQLTGDAVGEITTANGSHELQRTGEIKTGTRKITSTLTTITETAGSATLDLDASGSMSYMTMDQDTLLSVTNYGVGTWLILVNNSDVADHDLTFSGTYTSHYPAGATNFTVKAGQESILSIAVFNATDVYFADSSYEA